MGKGDIKTGKGKRTNGSYGNTRKRKKATTASPVAAAEKPKKAVAEKKAPVAKKAAVAKPAAEKKPAAKKTVKKEAATEE